MPLRLIPRTSSEPRRAQAVREIFTLQILNPRSFIDRRQKAMTSLSVGLQSVPRQKKCPFISKPRTRNHPMSAPEGSIRAQDQIRPFAKGTSRYDFQALVKGI